MTKVCYGFLKANSTYRFWAFRWIVWWWKLQWPYSTSGAWASFPARFECHKIAQDIECHIAYHQCDYDYAGGDNNGKSCDAQDLARGSVWLERCNQVCIVFTTFYNCHLIVAYIETGQIIEHVRHSQYTPGPLQIKSHNEHTCRLTRIGWSVVSAKSRISVCRSNSMSSDNDAHDA